MDVRALGPLAGLLGGLCWAVRWLADLVAGGGTGTDWLRWAGIALLLAALALVGAGLVSRGALWLRLLVAVAFPLLVASVYAAVVGEGDAVALEGVLGLLAAVAAVVAVVRGRRSATRAAGGEGRGRSHA